MMSHKIIGEMCTEAHMYCKHAYRANAHQYVCHIYMLVRTTHMRALIVTTHMRANTHNPYAR